MTDDAGAIQAAVSKVLGIPSDELIGWSRIPRVCFARQVTWYLQRSVLGLSYPELGRLYKRDHSTVLLGVRKAEKWITENPEKAARLLAEIKDHIVATDGDKWWATSLDGGERLGR